MDVHPSSNQLLSLFHFVRDIMTNSNERLHVVRASLSHQPNIWRTVLIPERFSLLQLHIVLQDLFGWRDSEYSFHIYHQSTPNLPQSDLGECPEVEALLPYYYPSVVYQLVLPNECDSWVKPIAPGVYIGRLFIHMTQLRCSPTGKAKARSSYSPCES
ncbi:hypothetical protein K493DRAFT_316511 [Basidiobolus meristosporus CBS 931.73]|uniref:Plasmid pRiA4b Orf3-like domain-containing protein n=1 Tax=Basidiobolus meristosporus CBS 931.73 TaxID=1314790 RepID=A0A1Y1Y3L2_9FUNG|nr:hypothetical protein K493DRAFT_316511 [Basidiobolus meristosporus CBS 931.73]|eukprot:ORX92590.1 hypothetical protein K493DRAFT_316511 [Basidiobolus meristosporus CBS 931.73]